MSLRTLTLCALAALALVAGTPDGQAKGGTPITACGQVVTASAFLTRSLYCPGSSGVVVGASGITIDLKGFSLRGDNLFSFGIDDRGGFDRVTIRNGVVRTFHAAGVYAANGADELSVSGLVVSGVAGVGMFVSGDSASITSSTFSGNGSHGVEIVGNSGSIVSSSFLGNVGHGVSIQGNSASVKSSTVAGNAGNGVDITGDSSSIASSSVFANTLDGISIDGEAASVRSSTASGNGGDGIRVAGDAAVIRSNRAEANGFSVGSDGSGLGIEVVSGSYTTPPVGTNVARGNDAPNECNPSSLC